MASKQNKPEPQGDELAAIGRTPVFKAQFREDLIWWARKQPRLFDKILDLVEEIVVNPFEGTGKPEPLRYMEGNLWSRRINQEHRLVYRVTADRIYFIQARYHY